MKTYSFHTRTESRGGLSFGAMSKCMAGAQAQRVQAISMREEGGGMLDFTGVSHPDALTWRAEILAARAAKRG